MLLPELDEELPALEVLLEEDELPESEDELLEEELLDAALPCLLSARESVR